MQNPQSYVGGRTVLGILALLALLPQAAEARRHAADGTPRHGELAARAQAEKLRAAGTAALAEHRLEAARQALEESYESQPASETLYYLGQLALAEGHPIQAQDLMQRFLHESAINLDPQQQQEATRILAIPSLPYGELEVLGARGAFLRVDNQLLGVLPLSRPMRLPSGQHTVQVRLGVQHLDGPIELRSGRTAQLRFDLQTGVAVVTLPATVLLVQDYGTAPAPVQDALARAVEQATRGEQHAVLHPIPALVRAPELRACVRTRPCQVQLMLRNEVDYTVALSVATAGAGAPVVGGQGAGQVLHAELLDAAMGEEVVLALDQPLDLTTPEPAASLVGGLVTRLLREGRARPRGTLAITSTPPGAQVLLPRGPVGVTPYEHVTWTGPYSLVVQKSGYKPAQLTGTLTADKKESLQVTLEPLPGPPPRRALWRTVTGAIAIGLGGTLVLTNTTSLFSSDSGTVATGAGLFSLGSALAIGGVLLLTLPAAKPKAAPRTATEPSPPPPSPAPASAENGAAQ